METRFQLSEGQISTAKGLASNYIKKYGDNFNCSTEFLVKLCEDCLLARHALEAAEGRAEKAEKELAEAVLLTGLEQLDRE